MLTSTLEVAKVLKLKAPFYDRNPSTPSESEAALVALGLVYGATREQCEWWTASLRRCSRKSWRTAAAMRAGHRRGPATGCARTALCRRS